MKNIYSRAEWRFRQARSNLRVTILVLVVSLAAMGAFGPQAVNRAYGADTPGPDTDEAMAGADLTAGSRPTMVFELESSASNENWQTIQHALESHAKLKLTIWYDFGSLHLQSAPENDHYRIDLTIERELAENEKTSGFTCTLDRQHFAILDLVRDGSIVRSSPPGQLPEALKAFCRAQP
jgi:hypothetical protein